MKKAFVFPGQGSQFVGMGKELFDSSAAAREVFEEVDAALGENLTKTIFAGPEDDLKSTQNTQPALMAVSIAVIRTIESESNVRIGDLCSYMAGHSLGEYSALCAAGSISLSDTAKLLRIRGNAMQQAVPHGEGGMAALIGVDFETAAQIAKAVTNGGSCQAANDNGGGQVVISGSMLAIDRALEIAPDYGVKRAIKLPVSAPFHSILMQPAADIMQEALQNVNIQAPSVPIIANVTAEEVSNPDEIRALLVKQVTGMVRWRETILNLKEKNVAEIVEFGAGKVLNGLIKRIDKEIITSSIQTPEDIENFLKGL